ncbi:hypothetical protein DPMN_121382 [Dreissena polymorpha]|uniref:Uncharacterized protein n=1 Tax=Dreissena polymorpha TaxID=45954 RepID=A0A9D4GMP6_DREPO|nr:hypothetical protein DPMN_121382 [Dreissena polymorpha]
MAKGFMLLLLIVSTILLDHVSETSGARDMHPFSPVSCCRMRRCGQRYMECVTLGRTCRCRSANVLGLLAKPSSSDIAQAANDRL